MHRYGSMVAAWAVLTLAGLGSWLLAQPGGTGPVKRAVPPKFNQAEVENVFFPDVFAELRGERPNFGGSPAPGGNPPGGAVAATPGGAEASPAGGGVWGSIISASTLEDEIKAIKTELDKDITTPGRFMGGDYKKARKNFSVLALLFAAIAEHGGDVRFKKDAPNARILFARAASNCKVGTQGSYDEARGRKDDLEALLSGGSPTGTAGDTQFSWAKVADRGPLMQRLEASHHFLQPAVANKGEFTNNVEKVLHEAELVAAISELMKKEGMKDADDNAYVKFCDQMKAQAGIIVTSAKGGNYDEARKAVGEIDKMCTNCHMDYRS